MAIASSDACSRPVITHLSQPAQRLLSASLSQSTKSAYKRSWHLFIGWLDKPVTLEVTTEKTPGILQEFYRKGMTGKKSELVKKVAKAAKCSEKSVLTFIYNQNKLKSCKPDVKSVHVPSTVGQYQSFQRKYARACKTCKATCGSFAKGKSPKAIKSKRKEAALDINAVKRDLLIPCNCILRCNTNFSPHEVMYWRYKIHSLPEGEERMQKLIEILKLSSCSLRKHERNQLYRVNQKSCCRSFFVNTLLHISVATFTRVKRSLSDDKVQVYDNAPRQYTHAVRGRVCEGFIREYMESACDRDPTGLIYRMPVGISKLDFHAMYKITYEDGLQKSEFYNILDEKFDNLVFSKSQRFTKCTQCHDFRLLIEKEKDADSRALLIARRNLHLQEQQLEREAYYVRRAQAEMRPQSVLSLILDGMDQSKTDLPHYAMWNTPSSAGAMKLRTHILGSIAHGRGKYFFVDHGEVPHDTNLSLTCLMKILEKEAKDGVLPPTLYVQLDNTARENKNRYFLGLMAYLVFKGYVSEVFLSFLFVGHTHEDIDQSFSKISQMLRNKDAVTMEDLLTVIKSSQSPEPQVEETNTVWDIKSWLEDSVNQVHNVTFPKLYRIFKDDVGHVTVKYKKTSTEDEWHPKHNERPLEIFKLNEDGTQLTPTDYPDPVIPAMDSDMIKDLKRSILKDFKLAQFTPEKQGWWENFLEVGELNVFRGFPTFNSARKVPPTAITSLSQKEIELIKTYENKRTDFKEVFTKQQGVVSDRRHYLVGEMIVFKENEVTARIGKILSISEDSLGVEVYRKQSQKFTSENKTLTIHITKCFPCGFHLTNSGSIPISVKRKIQNTKLSIR